MPFAVAPLDKPALTVDAKLPPASIELPPLPLAALTVPAGEKPVLPTQPPRTLPCIGAWTGAASESLECGRARFQKGEYDDAVKALESAARPGSEREIATEARYWLAETYYRLGRIEQADWLFRQGALDLRQDWGRVGAASAVAGRPCAWVRPRARATPSPRCCRGRCRSLSTSGAASASGWRATESGVTRTP